ncbi:DUF6802 family protein [Jongsikchunia kroppenstedtii]|uniref:DUF6802 family protein n=1 Tax=Jongsikchunia kroppenstedtii TaxID=1121721 RepID=UPI0003A6C961|nr:DUF6802 family protein [Jongsikchunia kroppenstedtii]
MCADFVPEFAESPDDVGSSVSARHNLWVVENDRTWDLGPAEVDTDADGIADSLTRNGPDGLTVYTDSDRDGQIDRITQVRSDGSFVARRLEPASGRWVPTDSGRLD